MYVLVFIYLVLPVEPSFHYRSVTKKKELIIIKKILLASHELIKLFTKCIKMLLTERKEKKNIQFRNF